MANNCLNWNSKEVEELAKQVGVVNTPAFADKIGTLMDNLSIEDIEQLPTPEQVKEYLETSKPKSIEKGKVVNPQGLAYAQCRLPALWKELFEDQFWMNKDGDIDFNKVDKHLPDLLKAFGYRIPNEDKYSSLPLRVTGFLPTGSGGAIMLPAEITTISGSDFDVDKMYVIIKKLVKGKRKVNKFTKIKDGVNDIFDGNPELAEMGSKEEYSAYIDSIFPDSKVKDIVYHGSPIKDLNELKRGDNNFGKMYTSQYGISFTDKDLIASHYAGKIDFENPEDTSHDSDGQVYRVILNIKNPKTEDFKGDSYGKVIGTYNLSLESAKEKDGNDSFIAKNISDPLKANTYVVFNPEQIHILGSKQDIEGFKKFKNRLNAPNYQVEQYLDNNNSTKEQRKALYASRTDKGRKIKDEYKPELKEISQLLKGLKYIANTIDEIGHELDILEDQLEMIKEPSEADINAYKLVGKDITSSEFKESVEKEISDYLEQLSQLNEVRDSISDNAKSKEVQTLLNKRDELIKERDLRVSETVSDEEFDKLSIAQQNTKGARDNEKLDTFIGIYSNPHTAMDIMTPGGYESIRKIAEKINKNKVVPRDVFGSETMDALTLQNIQGRDYKGIAANHNSHSSKRQWSNLKLNFPIMFDGRTSGSDMLNGKVANSVSGKPVNITRNFAEILAASVDNGKDPLLASINYNQHTADVISLMLATGADINTVFAFINQPVVLKAIEMISLGEERDLLSALKTIAKSMGVETKVDKITVTNFNQDKLFAMIGGDSTSVAQGQVLANIIKYTIASKDFSDLIAASKADTKGIGKFMEEGITLMRNIKKALTLKTISGTEEFLKGDYGDVVISESDDNAPVKLSKKDIFTVKPIQAVDKKASIKASVATKYIGFGEGVNNSSTELYRKQSGEFANTGNYSKNDVIFVSIGGKRGNEVIRKQQQDRTIKEALNAIKSGATLITDNKSYIESSDYNEGEKRLYKNLEHLGYNYSEQIVDGELLGLWNSKTSLANKMNQKFNNIFAKYGVQLPLDNIMSKLYPFLNESFSTIKDVIEQDLGYSISADDARLVDQMLVQYYSSKFEWYSKDNKFNIVKNLPGDINFLKATYPEFVKSDEIKPLFDALVSGTDNRLGMDIIEFDNSQTSSDEQRTDIKKSWKALSSPNAELVLANELLKSNLLTNEELSLLEVTDDYKSFNNLSAIMQFTDKLKGTAVEKLIQDYLFDKLANDLIKYSFYTTGLNFTPKSISSLVPIDLYSTISYNGTLMPDMIYGIQNMQNPGVNKSFDDSGKEISDVVGGTDASRFLDQFYKHMADNRKFVPRAEFKDGGGKDNTITLVDENKIIIIPEITENDKLWTKDKDGYLTATSRYISYKVDGKISLYENEPSGDNGMLFFRKINTLGAQGLLYEFDNNGGESSIVPGNNIDNSIKTMDVPTRKEVEEQRKMCKNG